MVLLNSPNNSKERPGATSTPSFKPRASQPRILVAEDNPDDVFLLKRAFAKGGVQVPMDFVKDGQEAIDYLQEKPLVADGTLTPPPTMLLLDLKMPRLDGFEVLEWIRQQPKLRTMFVVILSSSGLEQDRRRAYALGADNYAVKPSDPSEMIQLAQHLEAHWSGKNTASSSDRFTD